MVFTAHGVNAARRDDRDSWLNRLTLRIQYRLTDQIFVHTQRMKGELLSEFGVPESKVTVIPFGINDTVPNTALTPAQARARLGIGPKDKTLLFFGNIAPYKGLEHLIAAFDILSKQSPEYRLVIAGRPKAPSDYWQTIQSAIVNCSAKERILTRFEYVPDEETEIYFKAADVLVLPYVHIFQSGVLFLSYNFGLPVLAADVGSLREEIVDGETGACFAPADAKALARAVGDFFSGKMYLSVNRSKISSHAAQRYSWTEVVALTAKVYSNVSRKA